MARLLGTTSMDDVIERMHVKMQVGGKRVLWSARRIEETLARVSVNEEVIAYDELHFETVPATSREDAIRLASTVEVICLSIGPEIPARLTFEIENYNHEEFETETLQ